MTAPLVVLSTIGGAGSQFFDNNGIPCSGGKLYTYDAGTTNPSTTYTDSTGGTPSTNPVVLDSAGRVPNNGIWLVSEHAYKLVLKDATGATTFGTWDQLQEVYGATVAQVTSIATIASIAATTAAATDVAGGHSIGLSTWTKLILATKVYDLGTNYDTLLYRFTAPVAGMYLVTATIPLTKGTPVLGENCQLAIYKNGSITPLVSNLDAIIAAGTPSRQPTLSHLIKLAVTDYIELWAWGNGGAGVWTFNVGGSVANQLSITRIS